MDSSPPTTTVFRITATKIKQMEKIFNITMICTAYSIIPGIARKNLNKLQLFRQFGSNPFAAGRTFVGWQFLAGILPNRLRPVPIVLGPADHMNVQLRRFVSYRRDVQAIAGEKPFHRVANKVYFPH
jgi:hypothetical protein